MNELQELFEGANKAAARAEAASAPGSRVFERPTVDDTYIGGRSPA